jgi:hypothetical protein
METTEWQDPDSLLAPLIIGAHRIEDRTPYVYGALQAVTNCLPETGSGVKAVFHKQRSRVRRSMYVSGEQAKPYSAALHCNQVAEDFTGSVPFGHRLWSVGLYEFKDGTAAPAIGPELNVFCLEVSLAKVVGGYIAGGLHLALARHLWVEFMRAYDPALVVFGGQTRFEDSWWRPSAQSQAQSKK